MGTPTKTDGFTAHLKKLCPAVILWAMLKFFQLRQSDQRTVAVILTIFTVLLCWCSATGKQETLEPRQYQFRIDLNAATLGELQTLPGIGPKLAENIVHYRDQHMPIHHFDEILNVRGIGNKRYNALQPYFTD